jgi:hypothetical protein
MAKNFEDIQLSFLVIETLIIGNYLELEIW